MFAACAPSFPSGWSKQRRAKVSGCKIDRVLQAEFATSTHEAEGRALCGERRFDDGGQTPPQPGVRNSNEGLYQVSCNQDYITIVVAKPLAL